jgi:hypothetical protein
MKMNINFSGKLLFTLLFILSFVVACTPSSDEGSAADEAQPTEEEMQSEEEVEHDEEMEHDEEAEHSDEHEHDEDESLERVPNNGAAIDIVSPAEGATFNTGDEVTVEVEVENFTLGEGNHWHIYVDGSSWGMVMGENTDDTMRGLEPGEHEISVYLSIDTHEELEDGDAVTIVVEE